MCAITDGFRNERGVGIVAVLLLIVALALVGTIAAELVVREMDSGRSHLQSEQALFVAEAGLEYGRRQMEANRNWSGVAAPGIPVGPGSFTVWTTPYDANGTPLAAGIVAIRSRGSVGNVRRELTAHAHETGTTYELWSTAAGNAVGVPNAYKFAQQAQMMDGPPNGVYASGVWTPMQGALFTSFTGTLPGSGTVSKVEALYHGYVDHALVDDYVNTRTYWNNARAGRIRSISRRTLNTRIGAANAGVWVADISLNRAWVISDFSGDLELSLRNIRANGDDGATIRIDAVGVRVTLSSGGSLTFQDYREVNS